MSKSWPNFDLSEGIWIAAEVAGVIREGVATRNKAVRRGEERKGE